LLEDELDELLLEEDDDELLEELPSQERSGMGHPFCNQFIDKTIILKM